MASFQGGYALILTVLKVKGEKSEDLFNGLLHTFTGPSNLCFSQFADNGLKIRITVHKFADLFIHFLPTRFKEIGVQSKLSYVGQQVTYIGHETEMGGAMEPPQNRPPYLSLYLSEAKRSLCYNQTVPKVLYFLNQFYTPVFRLSFFALI